MQVHELVDAARFLRDALKTNNLPNQYQELINAVNQASQNQEPQNVTQLLSKIYSIHDEAEKVVLSPAQSRLLEEYGALKLIGGAAKARVKNIFERNQAYPQGIVNELKEVVNETNQLQKKSDQLISSLDPLFDTVFVDSEAYEQNEGRLWLYFSDDTSVDSIDDLESASENWRKVIHAFSRLPDASNEKARIIQIKKRSPLELELAANLGVLIPLGFGVQWVLSRIEHVVKILQEVERLKSLRIENEVVEKVKQQANEEREKISQEAADEVQKKYGADNEARNAVQQGLSVVVRFVQDGGQLDIDSKRDENENNEEVGVGNHDEVRALIQSIREKMRELPSPDEGPDDD